MNWHILGAGAIGCLWALRMRQADLNVTLINRSVQAPNDQLIKVKTQFQTHSINVKVESATEATPIQHLLITTKSYDTLSAVASVAHRLSHNCQIVLLQNGYGHQQQLIKNYPHLPIWLASTTAGAWRHSPYTIECVSEGTTLIGSMQPHAEALPDGWSHLRPEIVLSNNIDHVLWKKLAINCAINPLTAYWGCKNGQLLEKPELKMQMQQVCQEIEALSALKGIQPFSPPLFELACDIALKTAENHSSMLQDIRANKKTEIDDMTGYICKEAKHLNLDVPMNSELYAKIQRMSLSKLESRPTNKSEA